MTDVVIDLGCYPHDELDSVLALVNRFRPSLLLGYDPLLTPVTRRFLAAGPPAATMVLTAAAAWTWDGQVGFDGAARMGSHVDPDWPTKVPCFALPSLVTALRGHDVVLKLDVEGGEYPLLMELVTRHVWPTRIVVEWHTDGEYGGERRALIEKAAAAAGVPVEEWWM